MSTNKSTENKNTALEEKTISELLEIAENTKRILEQKQAAIRENAVEQIKQIALESGLRVMIREPKKRGEKSAEKLYRNPDDHSQTWTSKKAGAKPKWLSEFLKNGRKLEEFEVKTETEATTATA